MTENQENEVQDVEQEAQVVPQPTQVSPEGDVQETQETQENDHQLNPEQVDPNKGYAHVAGKPATGSESNEG